VAHRGICPGLRDRVVRERFDHGGPAVQSVLHLAFTRSPCDCERICLHCARSNPVVPNVAGWTGADGRAWRAAKLDLSLRSVARRFFVVRNRLCFVERNRSKQGIVARLRGCGDWFERCRMRLRRVCGRSSFHAGRFITAPPHASTMPAFPRFGFMRLV